MNPELTKLIERYLNGELTPTEKAEFEQKMSSNEVLRKEVELQRMIHEAANRLSLRTQIKSTGKAYHLLRKAIIAGIVTLSIAIGTGVIYFTIKKSPKELSQEEQETLHTLLDKSAPIKNLKTHYFQWKGNDTVFVSPNGVLLSVPENAYKHAKGETMTLQYQEAMDIQDIVKSGLSTMSDDQLLETQGMFGVQAFNSKGKRLEINPEVGVYVQVPVDEVKKGMMLFEGKKTKDGIIDWQNPSKLEKLPTLAKMSDLNFYPPGYEDTLNKIKARKDKKYRDSLYLSMEEFLGYEYNLFEQKDYADTVPLLRKSVVADEQVTCGSETIPYFEIDFSDIGKFDFYIDTIYNYHQIIINHPDFAFVNVTNCQLVGDRNTSSIIKKEIFFPDKKFTRIILPVPASKGNYFLMFRLEMKNKKDGKNYLHSFGFKIRNERKVKIDQKNINAIPPSKVLALWNKKFDKTNLATRDFEKRMRVIHKTCNPKLLELYTKNLNLPLWQIDEMIVKMGYTEFQFFADEHVGKVELSNEHQENLSKYYEKLTADLRKEAKEVLSYRLKKENEWNEKTSEQRSKNQQQTVNRDGKNLNEEIDVNMESVYKQLGKKRPELQPSVGFTIRSNVNVYNIDRFVVEKTMARQSGSFYDKDSGKTAKIIYNKMKLKVQENAYERLYVYLFPSKLSSFHRLKPVSKNTFEYALNAEMQYDLAIVGFKENGYYFYSKKNIPASDLGEIALEKVSETKLNASLESMNHSRYNKNDDISEEISWLLREQQDYVVQKQRQKMQLFRERIRKVVFPCAVLGIEYIPTEEEENPQKVEEIQM